MLVRIVTYLLRHKTLSITERIQLTNVLLDKLAVIPTGDILVTGAEGRLVLQGKPIDIDTAKVLRDNAKTILQSPARNIVRDQVAFQAITLGVHCGETPEQIMFSKAALWWYQQEDVLLKALAQENYDLGV